MARKLQPHISFSSNTRCNSWGKKNFGRVWGVLMGVGMFELHGAHIQPECQCSNLKEDQQWSSLEGDGHFNIQLIGGVEKTVG